MFQILYRSNIFIYFLDLNKTESTITEATYFPIVSTVLQ
jgi:hypothetical protein